MRKSMDQTVITTKKLLSFCLLTALLFQGCTAFTPQQPISYPPPQVEGEKHPAPQKAIEESGTRKLYVDETIDEKANVLKFVTEMPGIEKADIKVNIEDNIVSISAARGTRKYKDSIPLKYKVDENSAKAKYTNGILELSFTLAEKKPKGKIVTVQ